MYVQMMRTGRRGGGGGHTAIAPTTPKERRGVVGFVVLIQRRRGDRLLKPEVCAIVKRDLCMWQKRPMYVAKETYVCGKRDLLMH